MISNPILTICITSYNRVGELIRCLASIDCFDLEKIEVIVSEDKSPKQELIIQALLEFKSKTQLNFSFFAADKNIGFDRNIDFLIKKASGEYVLLMSDDDVFIQNALSIIIDRLTTHKPSLAFTPFVSCGELKRSYKSDILIKSGMHLRGDIIFAPILFSGLVFNRNLATEYTASCFLNNLYYQVYLFHCILYEHGGMYINTPLVSCIGDGINGFGLNESGIANEFLADRKSPLSPIEYHKGLIKAIEMAGNKNESSLLIDFAAEYFLRSFTLLSNARNVSRRMLTNYYVQMNNLPLQKNSIHLFYYIILLIFGSRVSSLILAAPRKLLNLIRSNP